MQNPDLKPSEQLLGKQHQPGMRADLLLLCGIYDLLHEIKAGIAPEIHVRSMTIEKAQTPSAKAKK